MCCCVSGTAGAERVQGEGYSSGRVQGCSEKLCGCHSGF